MDILIERCRPSDRCTFMIVYNARTKLYNLQVLSHGMFYYQACFHSAAQALEYWNSDIDRLMREFPENI